MSVGKVLQKHVEMTVEEKGNGALIIKLIIKK
jgi:hypothetical protein